MWSRQAFATVCDRIFIFGGVFFLLFNFITYETKDPAELLNQVKIGSATKRWQSAFELSKVLNDPARVPEDISFKNLLPLLEQWNESVNGEWADRKIELILNVREET